MKPLLVALAWVLLSPLIGSAYVETPAQHVVSSVTVEPGTCSFFILSTPTGFAVLEWRSGYYPRGGDPIDGWFDGRGFKVLKGPEFSGNILTFPLDVLVRVEAFGLAPGEALITYRDGCGF